MEKPALLIGKRVFLLSSECRQRTIKGSSLFRRQFFGAYRGKKIRFLAIGVSKGGSLQMWRKYFGEDAIIYGIDIDPECAQLDGIAGQVRIGSQADTAFLESVVAESLRG